MQELVADQNQGVDGDGDDVASERTWWAVLRSGRRPLTPATTLRPAAARRFPGTPFGTRRRLRRRPAGRQLRRQQLVAQRGGRLPEGPRRRHGDGLEPVGRRDRDPLHRCERRGPRRLSPTARARSPRPGSPTPCNRARSGGCRPTPGGGVNATADGRTGAKRAMEAVTTTCKRVSSVNGLYDCSGHAAAWRLA